MSDTPVRVTPLHLAAWMSTDARLAEPLDEMALGFIGEALAGLGTTCTRWGKKAELRASLVKVLAAIEAAPMSGMTEDQAFKMTSRLREELYLEMFQFRRAAGRDFDAGAFDA